MDKEKIAWMLCLCVCTFALVPPIHRLSRAVEELWKHECVMIGTIPEKPDSSKGWRLKWVQTHKERR